MGNFLARGQERADAYLRDGIETWVDEGRIGRARADEIEEAIMMPEVAAGLFHFGVHFAISIPLRSPLGSIARFFYTLTLRLRAEMGRLLGHGKPVEARQLHTVPVMLVALIPGFGRLAYLFSAPLAKERLLLFIPLDQTSRHLPFKLYRRWHLDTLFTYWALGDVPGPPLRRILSRRTISYGVENLQALRVYARPLAVTLAINAAVLIAGTYLYVEAGQPRGEPLFWWFAERSVVPTLNVVQLLIAAFCGFAAYRSFWLRGEPTSLRDSAGMSLWGFGGFGLLLFALDDYFTVHETMGNTVFLWLGLPDGVVKDLGDMLILFYALVGVVVLYLFRMELLSRRPSATLLQLAGAASVVMVAVDAFGWTIWLEALEYPFQSLACCLLMLAFYSRYQEARNEPRTMAANEERHVAQVTQ